MAASDHFPRPRTLVGNIIYQITTTLGVISLLSVAGPTFIVMECLEKMAPWTRYRRAYTAKVLERAMNHASPVTSLLRVFTTNVSAHAKSIKESDIKIEHITWRPAKLETNVQETGAIMKICKYDLVVVMSHHLHYRDLLSLSRTCRDWHDCVFPPNDLWRHQRRFKQNTCEGKQKECWSCRSILCKDCAGREIRIDQDLAVAHKDRCKPYCTPCFKRLMRGNVNRVGCNKWKDRRDTALICDTCNRKGKSYYFNSGRRKIMHLIRKADSEHIDCHRCQQPLQQPLRKPGPRWWVCKKRHCEHECRSSCHETWTSQAAPAGGEGEV